MWLTGRLMPDFKTIADFRRDNGPAIRVTCRQFVLLCRKLDLFSDAIVGIDGSKFKALNNRDKNYTPYKLQRRIEQIDASIARYLSAMEAADRQESEVAQAKSVRLKEKIAALREQMQQLRAMEEVVRAAPDGQVSLTDPDARSMATSGKGTGIVGYNLQIAVDAEHHLIVAHEVTNVGSDRAQLTAMSRKAREAADARRSRCWPTEAITVRPRLVQGRSVPRPRPPKRSVRLTCGYPCPGGDLRTLFALNLKWPAFRAILRLNLQAIDGIGLGGCR